MSAASIKETLEKVNEVFYEVIPQRMESGARKNRLTMIIGRQQAEENLLQDLMPMLSTVQQCVVFMASTLAQLVFDETSRTMQSSSERYVLIDHASDLDTGSDLDTPAIVAAVRHGWTNDMLQRIVKTSPARAKILTKAQPVSTIKLLPVQGPNQRRYRIRGTKTKTKTKTTTASSVLASHMRLGS